MAGAKEMAENGASQNNGLNKDQRQSRLELVPELKVQPK